MKFLITIFSVVLITLQIFAPSLLVSLFYANQKAIAEKYCINKTKPKLHCDGKCYLRKKLNQINGSDTNDNNNSEWNINLRVDPFVVCQKHKIEFCFINGIKDFQLYKSSYYPESFSANIFRPPVVVC